VCQSSFAHFTANDSHTLLPPFYSITLSHKTTTSIMTYVMLPDGTLTTTTDTDYDNS